MNLLAIETCCQYCSLTLNSQGQIFTSSTEEENKQAGQLFSLLEQILNQSKLEVNQINNIAITNGPGSFTGTRIGLAAAKGLARSLNIDIFGVSTLQVIAHSHLIKRQPERDFIVIFDVRKGQIAFQKFNSNALPLTQIEICNYDDLPKTYLEEKLELVGNFKELATHYELPNAEFLHDFVMNNFGSDLIERNPAPFYIREPDLK